VANRIDASMYAMQSTGNRTSMNRVFADSRSAQLIHRDHAVLLSGDPGDREVR
jgi:hypothetical protein